MAALTKVHAMSSTSDELKLITRRPSIDSSNATKMLAPLDPFAAHQLMPKRLRLILLLGGGCTGNEHIVFKALLLLCVCATICCACFFFHLIGMPLVPDTLVMLVVANGFAVTNVILRWSFLKAGILWSLAQKLDCKGKILDECDRKSSTVLYGVVAESVVVFGSLMILSLFFDVAGEVEPFSQSEKALLWCMGMVVMLFGNPISQFTFKLLPMLFTITYDLLVEEILRFQDEIDALFADDTYSKTKSEDLLEILQKHEYSLRMHVACVNRVLSPILARLLCCIFMFVFTCLFSAIASAKRGGGAGVGLTACYIWVAFIMFCMALISLQAAAHVGDTWIQLIDDMNTPVICKRSRQVLEIPLADRFKQMNRMGICVGGCVLTSEVVFSLGLRMIGGFILAVLGILISSG